MNYSTFTQWAGFLVPEYDENEKRAAGSETDLALRKEIQSYTHIRIGSSHDILLLFCHAISESISENVKVLNGTVNVDFLSKCKDATEFLDIVKKACEKYADKIAVRPFLGMDSDNENNLPLAEMLLESGIFAGIELYGSAFSEIPERFLAIFNTARRMNIDSRISCFGLRKLKSKKEIFDLLQLLRPSRLLNTNIALNDENFGIFKNGKIPTEIVDFTNDTSIHLEFSAMPLLSGKKEKEKSFAIREIAENQLPFSLCTEDVLFLNKSISEFSADLCNAGVFNVEEIKKIISN